MQIQSTRINIFRKYNKYNKKKTRHATTIHANFPCIVLLHVQQLHVQ